MSERLEWLDYAKGISIFLVVIFHASIALDGYGLVHEKYWLFNNYMSPIRMPVFFFISGYLAKNSLSRTWDQLLSRKIYTFLYLFVLWSLLHLSWRLAHPFLPAPSAANWVAFIYLPSGVLWFIWALAFYFLIAKMGQSTTRRGVFVPALILSMLTYGGIIDFGNFVHNNLLMFLPIFLLGAWYSRPLINSQIVSHRFMFPISFLAFSIAFAYLYKSNLAENLKDAAVFPMSFLGIIVGISASRFLCKFKLLKVVPSFLGRNTLSIYVAHSPIVGLLALGVGQLNSNAGLISVVGVPAVAVCATLLALGLKVLAEHAGGWWLYSAPFQEDASRRFR